VRPPYPSYENYYFRTQHGWRRFLPDVGEALTGLPSSWLLSGWVVLNTSDPHATTPGFAGAAPVFPVTNALHGKDVHCWCMASEIPTP
jgi:hypothetical protein